ncbi:MAG: flagellar hook-associated protein FlgK [candidate division KSB1 bacterium]|nr:flagellar hook-associated protein FlgK [candidate division KSB1 bacterium]
MSTLNGILELSKRSLMAHQLVANVIGNNVANVNTPGYSRQVANLVPSPSVQTAWGPMGTGVEVGDVSRYRDAFLDLQYRQSVSKQAHWEALSRSLSEVEAMFNDPGESGLQAALDEFWNAWSDLANDPENTTARAVVREKGMALAATFRRIGNYLREHIQAVDSEARKLVADANAALREVADLNSKIQFVRAQGGSANELMDQRDRLLDQLSEWIGARALVSTDGSVRVLVGTEVLVEAAEARPIQIHDLGEQEMALAQFLGPSGAPLGLVECKLSGLLEVRDAALRSYLAELDEIVGTLVREVNLRHRQGYTLKGERAGDFFESTALSATQIRLADGILEDLTNIAASSEDTLGDNQVALSIASLRSAKVMRGSDSLLEAYSSLIGRLGSLSAQAEDSVRNQEVITQTLENQRARVQGVSLDEEMVELIKFQHAYRASAQVARVVDEMMQAVLAMVR